MMAAVSRESCFADKVANLCLDHFERLPKKGKPQVGREWTLVAAVCMTKGKPEDDLKIVAMGTGSKCLGQSKMSKTGAVLNDSHAEVIARRAFLRYLYSELSKAYSGEGSDVFAPDKNQKCPLQSGVAFHLYTSHTPCGDASIFYKDDNCFHGNDDIKTTDKTPRTLKRSCDQSDALDEDVSQPVRKVSKQDREVSPKFQRAGESSLSFHGDGESSLRRKSKRGETLSTVNEASGERSRNESTASGSFEDEEVGRLTDAVEGSRQGATCGRSEAREDVTRETAQTGMLSGRMSQGREENHALESDSEKKVSVTEKDIHRTGAKCVAGGCQDPREGGVAYHAVRAFRTKPGRGERTLSMSCSDKIAKWNVLGCQGALLSYFLSEPIYFQCIIVGRCPYSHSAMQRALVSRAVGVENLPTRYRIHQPCLLQSSVVFPYSKSHMENHHDATLGKLTPSGAAMIWCDVPDNTLEVSVNGYKQGVTSKKLNTLNARCKICRAELFSTFKTLLKIIPEDKKPYSLRNSSMETYIEYKDGAGEYQQAWRSLQKVFNTWSHKPKCYGEFT